MSYKAIKNKKYKKFIIIKNSTDENWNKETTFKLLRKIISMVYKVIQSITLMLAFQCF